MSTIQTLGTFGAVLVLTFLSLDGKSLATAAALGQETLEKSEAKAQNGAEGVEKEVKAFIAHYIKTIEGGDEKAILALFVPDTRFSWFTDGAKSYSTPNEVLGGMRRYAGIKFSTTVSEVRVVPLSATLASARSKFKTKLTIPGADDHEFGGVITWLTEKDPASGKWKVLLGHTSTPGGPPSKDDESKKKQ